MAKKKQASVRAKSAPEASKPARRERSLKPASPRRVSSKVPSIRTARRSSGVVLLSGDNPQIAKADGDAPVQAYIAAIPGWKQDVARRLDELVVQTVPNVRKAVRWNTPFYGLEGNGWFLAFHCISKYMKVTFFRGTSLDPPPPVSSKVKSVRYLHIHEGEWTAKGPITDAQLVRWIEQAASLPGESCF